MSTPIVVFIFSYILFTFCNGEIDKDFCEVPTESCGPFIPRLPSSYMAKMEVTDIVSHSTKYAIEYYDGDNFRGATTWQQQGEETRILYDASAKTLITVWGWKPNDQYEISAQCVASPFIYNQDNFLIGVQTNNSITTKAYMILTGGVLQYNPDLQFKYNNRTTSYVRGMKADEWEACLYLPHVDGTFKISFYWSDLDSTIPTPSGEPSVPLKTKVVGKFRPNPENADVYEEVDVVTHFIWFQSNPPMDDELFQPPLGVFCQNDEKSKPFPSLPKTFSFFAEIQNEYQDKPDNVSITNIKMWYNSPAKLIRLQTFNNDTTDTISDFNAGITYIINEFSTDCKINEQDIGTVFPSAESELMLNAFKIEYLGKYTIRDRLCDTWSGKSDKELIQWSFLDETWHQNDKEGVLTRIPVQAVVTKLDSPKSTKTTINYFHFHPDDDEFPFDVDYCFGSDNRKMFQIAFQANFNETLLDFNSFALKCRVVLAREIQVSPLRISQVQAEYNKRKIFVQFSLLDKAVSRQTKNDVQMADAIINLKNIVNSNSLLVYAGNLPNSQEALYLTALPDSLLEVDIDPCLKDKPVTSAPRLKRAAPKIPPQHQQTLDLWTTGQLVGLGIGLFAIGAVLGVMLMLILLLRLEPRINIRREVADDGIQLTPTTSTQE